MLSDDQRKLVHLILEGDATYNKRFMDLWGELILAIRRSVRGTSTDLQIRDMLAGWVTDIDKYYPNK